MCSPKWSDAAFTLDDVRAAVADVAERSFFAMVDPCDDEQVLEASPYESWFSAAVRFDDGSGAGQIVCTLPQPLADRLFDAFSGREPGEPLPEAERLDLVGELTNMICGACLTRGARERTFSLSKPAVASVPAPAGGVAGSRLLMTINEYPFVVDVRAETVVPAVSA